MSTGVGAIRLFFGSFVSSFSLSLASRLMPAVVLPACRGVSGGVVIGTPPDFPPAVRLGMLPPTRGGLLTMPVGTEEDCVATEDVEFDLVGEEGRCETAAADGGGDGAVNELAEFR